MTNSKPTYKLTNKDFNQIRRRSLFAFQMGWNYERMQNTGYLFTVLPQLRKLYGDNTPELEEMMKTETQFFNTSNVFNTMITGIDLALQENEGAKSKETVSSLKVGLMGPFAAIGDSIFASLIPTIFGALAASMAAEGNPIGVIIWIIINLLIFWFRWQQLPFAFEKGTSLVTDMRDQLNIVTDAATVLGVFMVGALVATMINIKFAWVPQIGKVTMNVQKNLDMIIPKLLPALIVGFVYWLLGKKKMNSLKAILIVLIISIVLGGLQILAKG